MSAVASCTSRTLLFILLAIVLAAGLAVAIEGGVALGLLEGMPTNSRSFITYCIYCGTGVLMMLTALGGLIGACTGRASWVMCAFVFNVVALICITGSAVLATLIYVDYNKNQQGSAEYLWNTLRTQAREQFEVTYQCQNFFAAADQTTPTCEYDFTRFVYNTVLGTMIGGWACVVLMVITLAVALCTRKAIMVSKAAKKAAVEEEALRKAKVEVASANMAMQKPIAAPAGAPPLTVQQQPAPVATAAVVAAPAAVVASESMRPSDSTYTLADPYASQQYAQPVYATQPAPTSPAYSAYPGPASPYLAPSAYPGERPMSTASVAAPRPASVVPPSTDDMMSKV